MAKVQETTRATLRRKRGQIVKQLLALVIKSLHMMANARIVASIPNLNYLVVKNVVCSALEGKRLHSLVNAKNAGLTQYQM